MIIHWDAPTATHDGHEEENTMFHRGIVSIVTCRGLVQ
jgi:hypothetical protein